MIWCYLMSANNWVWLRCSWVYSRVWATTSSKVCGLMLNFQAQADHWLTLKLSVQLLDLCVLFQRPGTRQKHKTCFPVFNLHYFWFGQNSNYNMQHTFYRNMQDKVHQNDQLNFLSLMMPTSWEDMAEGNKEAVFYYVFIQLFKPFGWVYLPVQAALNRRGESRKEDFVSHMKIESMHIHHIDSLIPSLQFNSISFCGTILVKLHASRPPCMVMGLVKE